MNTAEVANTCVTLQVQNLVLNVQIDVLHYKWKTWCSMYKHMCYITSAKLGTQCTNTCVTLQVENLVLNVQTHVLHYKCKTWYSMYKHDDRDLEYVI